MALEDIAAASEEAKKTFEMTIDQNVPGRE